MLQKKNDGKSSKSPAPEDEEDQEEEPRVFELKRFGGPFPAPFTIPRFSAIGDSVPLRATLTARCLLSSNFYQQRLNRKRQAEISKRNRERLQDPQFFPAVPKNLP